MIQETITSLETSDFNINLFTWINNFSMKNDILDIIFIFMSQYLIYIIIIIFVLFFGKKVFMDGHITLKELVVYFSGAIISYIISFFLKKSIYAERPFVWLNLDTLVKHKDMYMSFPSGHTTFSFALAMTIFLYNKKMGIITLFLALFVALGRVLVGVHYPLDIFAGMIIGVFFPILIFYVWKFLKIKNPHDYYGTEAWIKNREKMRKNK